MPYVRNAVDGSRIYFEDDGGDKAPVVILGGFLDPIALVRGAPIAQALQGLPNEFRFVYVDHRGHGRSDKPHDEAAYAMPIRVADVVAVLDELGLERAHHVGLSWGGRLALGLGEYARQRARSLVVIGQQPYAIDPAGPLARIVGEALDASRIGGIATLVDAFEAIVGRYPDAVRDAYLECDAAAMRAAWGAAIAEGAISDDLASWHVPCLFCVAVGDVDFFDQARRAAGEIPGAEFVAVADEDHLGMDTARVDPVLPAVLRILRKANDR